MTISKVYRIEPRAAGATRGSCAACDLVAVLAAAGFCDDLPGCCYRADIRVRHAYGPGGDAWHWRTTV